MCSSDLASVTLLMIRIPRPFTIAHATRTCSARTMMNPVKFFPGCFSFEKFMPYFSNTNSFCCYQTHETRPESSAIFGTSRNYTYEFFFHTYIFTAANGPLTTRNCSQTSSSIQAWAVDEAGKKGRKISSFMVQFSSLCGRSAYMPVLPNFFRQINCLANFI